MFASQEMTAGQLNAVVKKLGGQEGAERFLRGELAVSEKSPRLLFVDRSVKPTYPDWKKEVLHPEHEMTGPSHLDPACSPLYLHPQQKKGRILKGNELYASLKETGLIEFCLSGRDGEELQKNPQLFPEAWKGKYVFLWKSVVRSPDGLLHVPCVCGGAGQVYFNWHWLDYGWCDDCPAALSAS